MFAALKHKEITAVFMPIIMRNKATMTLHERRSKD